MTQTLRHYRRNVTLETPFGGICNHEVLATEREPEGQAKRSNHEVLATEREPEGQAKRSNPAATEYKDL